MKSIITVAGLLLLMLFAPAKAQAQAMKLVYHRTVQAKNQSTKSEDVTVMLLPRAFITDTGAESIAYDFAARHMIVLDNEKKTAITGSLYGFPIFKAVERERRLTINAALEKTGRPYHLESPLAIDMTLGSNSNTAGTAKLITQAQASGTVTFSGQGQDLATYSSSKTALPVALRDSYRKFLIYTLMLHPAIKAAMAEAPDVLAHLSFRQRRQDGIEDVTYTLTSASPVSIGDFAIPEGYKTVYSDDPQVDGILARGQSPAPSLETQEKAINDLVTLGDLTDADLGLDELALTAPEKLKQDRKFLEDTFNKVLKDPQVKALQQALMQPPGSPEELERQLALFEKTKSKARVKGYMLDLQEAIAIRSIYNPSPALTKAQIRKLDQSLDLFKAALNGNPHLVGAWFDLGNASYADLDMPTAWTCWDQGRRLDPDYPTAIAVRDTETQAIKDFPEYF